MLKASSAIAGITVSTRVRFAIGLSWRPNAPRSADYRALASHLADTCRQALQ